MSSFKIPFSDFDVNRLEKTAIVPKTSKAKPDPQNPTVLGPVIAYSTMPLQYRYSVTTADGQTVDTIAPLCVEGPILTTPLGIKYRANPNGTTSTTIFTQFNTKDPAVTAFIAFYKTLYDECLERIFEARASIKGFERMTSKAGLEFAFAYPIHMPTGPGNAGRDPTTFFPLINYADSADGKKGRQTTFLMPIDETTGIAPVVEWWALENRQFSFIPVITMPEIYFGGAKASIQKKIVSAVIASEIKEAGVSSIQRDTVERLSQDKVLSATITAQYRSMMAARAAAGGGGKSTAGPAGQEATKADAVEAPPATVVHSTPPRLPVATAPPPLPTPLPMTRPIGGGSSRLAQMLSSGPGNVPGLPPPATASRQ